MIGKFQYMLIDKYRGTKVVSDVFRIENEVERGFTSLEEIRKNKLIKLLIEIKNNVPFYNNILARIPNDEINHSPFAILKELPIITKKDFYEYGDDIISKRRIKFILNKTGGSSGNPFFYRIDIESVSRLKAYSIYFWRKSFKYNYGDEIISIGGSSLNGKVNFKKKIYNKLQNKTAIEGGLIDSKDYINFISKLTNNTEIVIYAYPSALSYFVSRFIEKNIHINTRIKGIVTTSEQLLNNSRELIENYFGVPIFNQYGARDGGIIASECENHDGFHYNFQDCIIETDSESNLILTNLNSYSMPFVKYLVGDIGVIVNEPCECGLPLPRIKSLLGRTRDLINLNNKTIHGSVFNKIFYKYKSIFQYQIIKRSNILLIKVKTINNEKLNNEAEIISDLNKIINEELLIKIQYTNDFEYNQAGKIKTIINEE